MIEATCVLLCVTIALSLWACAAWTMVSRGRELRRLDGRAVPEIGDAAVATQLLVVIIIVDGVAAAIALSEWISRS